MVHFRSHLLIAAFAVSHGLAIPMEPADQIDRRAAPFPVYGDHTGSTSQYPDGSGTYVRSDDGYTYASGVKCWTDLFYVKKSYEAAGWVKGDTSIDCATTQTCSSGRVLGKNDCVTWTLGSEIKGEVAGSFLSVAQATFGLSLIGNGGQVHCVQPQSSDVCTWNDKACHAVWTSNVELVNQGYVRRRCHDKGQDYTAWSWDMSITVPDSQTRIGCAAPCAAVTYPDPVPDPPASGN